MMISARSTCAFPLVLSLLSCTATSVTWASEDVAECIVLADARLVDPLRAISNSYTHQTRANVSVRFLPAVELETLIGERKLACDVVLCMPSSPNTKTAVALLSGARTVAWKYPSGEPVWAAVVGTAPEAPRFLDFVGGPTGHRLWAESKAGFTITSGSTHAEAFSWVAEHRLKHTYAATALRMLGELGGLREGICIDIGCGPGNLDVELANRSGFEIIGLDIDPDMKPFFDRRIREAALQERCRFVTGDAQELPFDDDYADVIVSRGTLTFIPDISECLQEVDRVLKPTGVAFLGGRYLYTPQQHRISNEELKKLVRESLVPGALVIEHRGQWVKIIGPKAPKAAQESHVGPHMLAYRLLAEYGITQGDCLILCMNDSPGVQGLQRGLIDATDLRLTALYPTEKLADGSRKRILDAKLSDRITCKTGTLDALPFEHGSFNLIIGTGPVLIWGEREKKMQEVYRVLRPRGVAFIGGRYLGMPDFRKVSSKDLRASAAKAGIPTTRVVDDGGQWVEIRKPFRQVN